jgi:hypothetical protein
MSERRDGEKFVMHEVISFLPPIQVGYEIYYENLEIEGLQDRQAAVWQFIQGSNQLLDWEQEPSNPHDPHAIKILGISEQIFSTKHEMLGYVPGNVAKQIVSSGFWPFLQLRLDCIYVANQGAIAIRFQILGPIRKKSGDEKTAEKPLIQGEQNDSEATSPAHQTDREAEGPQGHRINIKRVAFFVLRIIVVTIGIGFAFVGGEMGTAAWQASENLFSMMMLLPATLVISGGLLIWTGIRPSKPRETTLT